MFDMISIIQVGVGHSYLELMCYFEFSHFTELNNIYLTLGNIVSLLGYLDILHLLDEAAKQDSIILSQSIENILGYCDVTTAPASAKLNDIIHLLNERNMMGTYNDRKTMKSFV
jgi:hypothetical protein